jgi:hypothetical protein
VGLKADTGLELFREALVKGHLHLGEILDHDLLEVGKRASQMDSIVAT